jgi:DNA transformation protein and related proteins
MANSSEFSNLIAERLARLGAIVIRPMFGGAGVYCGDTMFGLIEDDVLYLRVDDGNREDFIAAGSAPFTYARADGERVAMSYYRAPDHLLDDAAEMVAWAERALAAALRVKTQTKSGKPKLDVKGGPPRPDRGPRGAKFDMTRGAPTRSRRAPRSR